MTTRRDVIGRGLVAGGAVSATLPLLTRTAAALGKSGGEAAIVQRALELEQTAVVVYRTLANGDLLDVEVADAAKLFALQSEEHADALAGALEDLGGSPPAAPKESAIDGLDELDSQEEALEFAIELENRLVGTYDRAAAKLESRELIQLGAQIVGNA